MGYRVVDKLEQVLRLHTWSGPRVVGAVAETVAYLSQFSRLEPGDVTFTGTPEGVGAVKAGESMVTGVDGLSELTVRVV